MNNCNWEVIEEFRSPGEYARFSIWLDEQIRAGMVMQIPVKERYAGQGFEEKWYMCAGVNEPWRLVSPEGPFHGYWGPVG